MPRIIRKSPAAETATAPAAETPRTVAELEADARAGVTVSLAELADAMNREGVTADVAAGKRRAPRKAAPVAETTETPAPAALPAPELLLIPARDLVIAQPGGRDDDLAESDRDTREEREALRASIMAGGIAQPVQAVRRTDPARLVVLNGRRRVREALAIAPSYPVPVVIRPDVTGVRAELAAAELNETGVGSDPAVLVERLARAAAAGIEFDEMARAVGRASRARSLLAFADRAGPDLREWLAAGTIAESTACLMAEATDAPDVQRAALALLQAEVDAARTSPDGRSSGLTGSRKGDATIDDTGKAHVTRAAAAVAVSRALSAAGVSTRRTATVAEIAVHAIAAGADVTGPQLPAAPAPVAEEEEETTTEETAPAIDVPAWAAAPAAPAAPAASPAPAAASKPAASKPARPGALSGSVTAAASAALSRVYGVAPSSLTGDGRAFLSGLRAALDYLTTGTRPTGDTERRHGPVFSVVFPE